MWSNTVFSQIGRFLILVFLQVFLLNNINLAGYINPYVYILFIILYPLDGNSTLLILWSFLLGLCIDIFEDSGGVQAAASVFAAFVRPFVLKYSFGVSYEYNVVKLSTAAVSEKITYIGSIILVHHLVMFALEIFSFSHIGLLLKSTFFSGIFTFVLIYASLLLFSKKVE
ncbi:MAG TPA: rod shape-determining protein MreD [Flavobacteriaceae bacterium]|nr:rod shape-determining protein MreD [Flavobacteriaceae bacterium]